jgi:DNA-directed RNA polymerase subunit H (RpoH/RPB5)
MERTTATESRPTEAIGSLNTYMNANGLDLKTTDRYFKIHRTIVEMLMDRGYTIDAEEISSTKSLVGFLKFLSEKKIAEDVVFLEIFVEELLKQGMLKDSRNQVESFNTDVLPVLAEKMNPDEISESLGEYFETTPKLIRNLDDIVKDKLKTKSYTKSLELLNQIYQKVENNQTDKVYVYYYYNVDSKTEDTKVRINDVIMNIISVQKDNPDVKNILFVSETKPNTQLVDDLKKFKEKMRVEIFIGDHLLFNLTKHFLVPKHHLMTEEEQKEFLKDKEKGLLSRLPKIYDTDPVSRYYGAKVGQIFKIIRQSISDDTMVKTSEFYRYVVPEMKR